MGDTITLTRDELFHLVWSTPVRTLAQEYGISDVALAKIFQALGFRVDIEEVQHPDGRVLVFHIPGRPTGSVYAFEGAYLMRAGQQLVPMSEDRLRTIFAEGTPDWLSEPALRSCDDGKVVKLLDTQAYFDLLQLPLPALRSNVLQRFESEKLIRRDGSGWALRIWAEFSSRRSSISLSGSLGRPLESFTTMVRALKCSG